MITSNLTSLIFLISYISTCFGSSPLRQSGAWKDYNIRFNTGIVAGGRKITLLLEGGAIILNVQIML